MSNHSVTLNPRVSSPSLTRSLRISRTIDWLALIGLIVFLLVMLFPLLMVMMTSIKTEAEYYTNGPLSLPQGIDLSAISSAWRLTDYATKLTNSLIISLSTAVLATVLSLFNAFALGIGRVRGKTVMLIFFLMAITLPNESLAYPLYYFFKLIKLYDTQLSVILISSALHSAYGTYLLASVFSTFPRELIEAALIDGCNKLQLLFRIVVPISRASLSVLFVFFFIWTWNDFFLPLILLISNSRQTVQLALALAQGERNVVVTFQSATALLGVVPCLIFFVLFQRTLTKGVTAGSIK